jgi:hypothetical protein
VGEWDGAEPNSCTSVTPRASPVRRIVSMWIVQSGCRNERVPGRYRRHAGRGQAPYLRPRYESWRAQLLCLLPGERAAGSVAASPERGFCTGTTIASLAAELVARVPVPPSGSSGPRAAAREMSARVHGGTKARETSVARIGIT